MDKKIIKALKTDKVSKGIALVAILLALVYPKLGFGSYFTRIGIFIIVYTVLGLGLNLITGLAGQISLGHAAFFATGAYIGAILTRNAGLNFYVALVLAGVGAGLCGLILGLPTMRLSGAYLVIVTSGFAEVVKVITLN